jgi:hypothetical protein
MDVNVATYYQRQAEMANIREKDETSVSIEDTLPQTEQISAGQDNPCTLKITTVVRCT